MATLTENGYDYYKSKKYWTPAEAAGFVSGVQFTSDWLHVPKDYDEISLVLNASIEAFKNKKLKVFKKLKRRSETNYKDFYEKYCPDFCLYDDVYEIYYLSCFEPLDYIKWIVTEKIIRIPPIIGITLEGGLKWNIPPDYKEDEPLVDAINPIPKLDHERALYYKSLAYWTIPGGIGLSKGESPHGRIGLFRLHAAVIEGDYKIGKIKAIGHVDGKPAFSPFVLLDTWKKAGFDISPLFDFDKQKTNTGEIQYSWANDINEDADPVSNGNPIGQNKKSIIETDDVESKVNPEIDQVKKFEQDIKSNDPHARSFILQKDGWWKIIFDGENGLFRGKPIQYIAEVLKQPNGKPINYVKLGQLVEGPYIDNKVSRNDDLNIEITGKKHTEKEKQKMCEAIEKQYQIYLNNPGEHKDSWLKAKTFAENDYGIITKDDAGKLSFSESKWQNENTPEFEKARKTVSRNKTLFLNQIKEFKSLSEHFNTYLKTENGIVYNPPAKSPQWEIIDK